MTTELLIQRGSKIFQPVIEEGISWTTERRGVAGELKFSVVKDAALDFKEGDPVRLRVDDQNVFYGFVFSKKRDKSGIISVTAYDQIRYLIKNKDTYVYTGKTADAFIRMLANDFHLQTGMLENTGYVIPSRVEDNSTLMDMINNALDDTLMNTGEMYVLYDDFGKLTLKNIGSMTLDLLINEETGENYDYESSIDNETYNKIKLIRENAETGKRDIYMAQSGQNINDWGVLQYYETLKEGENGQAKADALLDLYNAKTRSLSISGAFGGKRVRGGSLVLVALYLGDITVNSYMLVEKVVHTFKHDEHTMDLTLRGGEFVV